jgi:hypothetical protein
MKLAVLARLTHHLGARRSRRKGRSVGEEKKKLPPLQPQRAFLSSMDSIGNLLDMSGGISSVVEPISPSAGS